MASNDSVILDNLTDESLECFPNTRLLQCQMNNLVGTTKTLAVFHIFFGVCCICHGLLLLPTLVECYLEYGEVPLPGLTDFCLGLLWIFSGTTFDRVSNGTDQPVIPIMFWISITTTFSCIWLLRMLGSGFSQEEPELQDRLYKVCLQELPKFPLLLTSGEMLTSVYGLVVSVRSMRRYRQFTTQRDAPARQRNEGGVAGVKRL